MKNLRLCLLLSLSTFCSCKEGNDLYEEGETFANGSFSIGGVPSEYGLAYLRFQDSNRLLSYDAMYKTAYLYNISLGAYNLPQRNFDVASEQSLCFGFFTDRDNYYVYDEQKKLWSAFSLHDGFTFSQRIDFSPNYTFSLQPGTGGTSFVQGDTLTTDLLYTELEERGRYFSGNTLIKWVCNKNGFKLLDTFARPDEDWQEHDMPGPLYTLWHDETAYLFPDKDTLFIRNSSTKQTRAISIRNRDYIKPQRYDHTRLGTDGYNEYQTKYLLGNFTYECLFYNEATGHLVLFYRKPVMKWADGEKVATFKDRLLYALVLSKELKPLHYVVIRKEYGHATMFFQVPGKGIAMPEFDHNLGPDDTTHIDIFNL